MVVSNINSDVSYPERKTIDEDDKGQDVSMFQIKLFELLVIAIRLRCVIFFHVSY